MSGPELSPGAAASHLHEPVLEVRGLHVTFSAAGRPVPAVRGLDLEVYGNEVLGIVGESGSGKSVTALAMAGLLAPSARVSGSIRLAGREVVGAPAPELRELRGREVGFVFQDPTTTLNPLMPVGRQVVEGEIAHGRLSPAAARPRAVELLREVDIADPAGRAFQYPHQFSGGMRQRAVIAMAMAGRPRLIIADEPTTALDVTVQAQVLALLARRQAETGAAVVLITHDLGVVAEVAHRVAVMYAGRIVETGSIADVFERPRHPYTAAFLRSAPRLDAALGRLDPIPGQPPNPTDLPAGCTFRPRCTLSGGRSLCAEAEPPLHALGEGRASACHFALEVSAERPAAAAEPSSRRADQLQPTAGPVLAVEGLEVRFPIKAGLLRRTVRVVRAVDGVSHELGSGETLGLVGESGCGKTTTGRAIMGLVRPSAGRILVDGRPIEHLDRRALRPVRRQIQYVFQDPYASLNPMLEVGDAIAEPLRIQGLYEAAGGEPWILRLLDMVGLPATAARRMPRELSGGQKQRVGIARALALRPRLLVLDEPVASLDVSIQAQIVNLLQNLQRELALAYLLIAHDLSVVKHVSRRVAVMYLGRIVEIGPCDVLYGQPVHPYTRALLSAVPVTDPKVRSGRRRIILEGEIPDPSRPPSGCHFHPRCFRASARCAVESPRLETDAAGTSAWARHHPAPRETDAGIARVHSPEGAAP